MGRSELSRRALIAGAGAAVAGWNTVARAWAAEPGAQAAQLSALDGRVILQGAEVERFSCDFGHLVAAAPRAVLRPGSVLDVQKTVAFARRSPRPLPVDAARSTGRRQRPRPGVAVRPPHARARPVAAVPPRIRRTHRGPPHAPDAGSAAGRGNGHERA
ncbi:hypothetical protein ABZW30_46370 [Kitasatospora sp. NPDC004669]|uniref:hypothetical protein n=1 Tax=Kitasatospora sp. NPDC004669 TaxID=3154555 RepID=UPI0033A94669